MSSVTHAPSPFPPSSVTPLKKPTQVKFFRPGQMALFAKLAVYPPLSQVTVVSPTRGKFNFTVILESSKSLPERPWEVSIWYDYGSYTGTKSPWQALDLKPVDHTPAVLHDDTESSNYRYTFSGDLDSPYTSPDRTYKGRRVPFTVRYRIDADTEWSWAYHNFGTRDGELVLQPPIDPNFLGAYPVEISEGWTIRKTPSEAPAARLYTIESAHPIPTPKEGNAKLESLVLGRVTQVCRWFALVRIWEPWWAPRHGETQLRLSEPAILLSFLRSDGLHVVLLAINGVDESLTQFKSTDNGEIVVEARNDSGKDRKFKVMAASAWKFEVANAAVMYEARKLVRQTTAYNQLVEQLEQLPKDIRAESVDSDTVLVNYSKATDDPTFTPQWLESWYDSLGYCTWNSLGQDLNTEKIMAGLDSLAKNKIHISTLVIDDNWQSLSGKQGETSQIERGWTAFEANPIGFPDGLKAAVSKIRETHPAIRDIAVWHALNGYWGGISPDGEIAKNYKTVEVNYHEGSNLGNRKLAVHPDDIHRLYDDFYRFLSNAGVTGVKTDVQFSLDLLADTKDRNSFTNTYQSAWTQAHLRHLSGRAISCMSMVPQILYHSFLPTTTPRIMLRNSDDFFPDVPTSHAWHVFANGHNALFTQHLNILPDWDMFQSDHPYSGFHAAARCLSGGPIYITDTPGKHDVNLINQMTAINPRGQTVILRPSTVGKTMGVYDKYDERGIFKLGVYDGKTDVGTGFLGVFNIAESEISFILPITKFPGVNAPESTADDSGVSRKKWIVRSHMSQRITSPIHPSDPIRPDSLLQCTLPIRGYDVWTALPVHTFHLSSSSTVDVALLGLLGKFTGACAIIESSFNLAESETDIDAQSGSRLKIHVQLKALGVFGIWLSDAESSSRKVDDMMVMILGKPVPPHVVKLSSSNVPRGSGVLEIDVEAAWNEMDLEPGWSNEFGIDVYLK
ncbi:stachyose synthetase [Exophiala viscosa]|uniref:Stachyose synthetase n=1 Tax=Exophiala viscosa TaxID=2486360 RepID=A0AAN6DXV9_9EURO|nr:stachyose synthetase [Exophiala viscosa]